MLIHLSSSALQAQITAKLEEDHNKHKGLKDEIEKLENEHNSRVKEYEVSTRTKDMVYYYAG